MSVVLTGFVTSQSLSVVYANQTVQCRYMTYYESYVPPVN